MRCLVTGGAGFIGSNLVKELLVSGHEVIVLDDLSSGREDNLADLPVKFILGDILDTKIVSEVMIGCDAVFHLAASVGCRKSIRHPQKDSATNVLGTINVLETAKDSNVRRFIFSSSAAIYGKLVYLPIREDHPCEPDSPYGCSKLCAEKLCLSYARLYGMGVVCLRYFNVYGPGQRYDDYGNVIPIFAERLMCGDPVTVYGDGEQTRDFVSVHDAVQANVLAMESGAVGAYNVGSGRAVSVNYLAEQMGCRVEYAPARPGEVLHSISFIDFTKTKLGYRPRVRLEQGLEEYLLWRKSL